MANAARTVKKIAKWGGILLGFLIVWWLWDVTGPHDGHPFFWLWVLIFAFWMELNAHRNADRVLLEQTRGELYEFRQEMQRQLSSIHFHAEEAHNIVDVRLPDVELHPPFRPG